VGAVVAEVRGPVSTHRREQSLRELVLTDLVGNLRHASIRGKRMIEEKQGRAGGPGRASYEAMGLGHPAADARAADALDRLGVRRRATQWRRERRHGNHPV
jgi:hypothetical protein